MDDDSDMIEDQHAEERQAILQNILQQPDGPVKAYANLLEGLNRDQFDEFFFWWFNNCNKLRMRQ
jgi:hypothetical protein